MQKLLQHLPVSSLATLNLTLLILLVYLLYDANALTPEGATPIIALALAAATALSVLTWYLARKLEKVVNKQGLAEGPLSLSALNDGGLSRRSLLDCLDEGIITSSEDGMVSDINRAAEKTLGYGAQELIGATNIAALLGEQWPLEPTSGYRQHTAYRKNGAAFTLEYSLKRVQLDHTTTYILVIRDITNRLSTEHELSRHRERLEELVRSRTVDLARARDQALEASRAKSGFLANMSHELRTPLNAIIGYSEIIIEDTRGSVDESHLADVEKIRTAGRHLLELINDVLDLSKIESGKMELHLEKFELAEVLDELAQGLGPVIGNNHNTLHTSFPGDLGQVDADLVKVRQVVTNLLSNAAKFTENGSITLRAERHQRFGIDWIKIEVSDTGIGMSPEQIENLFLEFRQGDSSTTRKYGGTGLGLAISRRYCEMMGGEIRVQSRLHEGSQFVVELPAHIIGPKVDPKEVRLSTAPLSQQQRRKKISRVLVIDDDPFARDLLERFLSREGFAADVAPDGETGLKLARETHPDVIILDVKMPDMDGWTVLSTIKAEAVTRDIPVIMLTMNENRELSLALGASDFLPKPIERKRLVDILLRHVRNKSDGPNPNPHVLIVEDDIMNQELLRRALDREGLSVAAAENGLIALQQIAVRMPELIFLDLMMPVMDGFEFLKELKKNEKWAKIPIVTLTAIDLTPSQIEKLKGQVEVVLDKKTLGPIELLQTVRKLVITFVRKPPQAEELSDTEQTPENVVD